MFRKTLLLILASVGLALSMGRSHAQDATSPAHGRGEVLAVLREAPHPKDPRQDARQSEKSLPIPEPGVLVLVGSSILGLAWLARRRTS